MYVLKGEKFSFGGLDFSLSDSLYYYYGAFYEMFFKYFSPCFVGIISIILYYLSHD